MKYILSSSLHSTIPLLSWRIKPRSYDVCTYMYFIAITTAFKKSPWILNGNSTAIAKPKVADTFVIRVREYQAEDFFIIFLLPKQSPTIFSGRYFPEAYGHTNASLTSLVCNPIYSNHLSTSIYTHYIVQLEGSTYKKVILSTGRSLRVSQEGARSHQFFEKRKQQSKFAIVVPRGVLRPLLLSGLYLTVS